MITRDHDEFYIRLAESPPGTYHLIVGRTLVRLSTDELAQVGRAIIRMAQRRSDLRSRLGLKDPVCRMVVGVAGTASNTFISQEEIDA